MGKKSGSAPAAPDPYAMGQAQSQTNIEALQKSAELNRVGEYTPYGNVKWEVDPERTAQLMPEAAYRRVTSLSPEMQEQFDLRNKLAMMLGGNVETALGTPFEMPGAAPQLQDVSDVEQRQFQRAMELMRPELERQERGLETRLSTRGIPIGGEAYGDVRGQFDKTRDEMIRGAAFEAMKAAQTEQGRRYGLERGAYEDRLSDILLSRSQPINELAALLQGSPAIQAPGRGSLPQYQMAPVDMMGAMGMGYQGDLTRWQQEQANRNAMLGGLAGLGAAAILASDSRLKRNIEKIDTVNGINWYSFEYLWSPIKHIGVMAQEILNIKPEAVHELPSGYLAVDYGELI